MKKRRNKLLFIVAAGAIAMSTVAFVGCGGDEKTDNKHADRSGLIGGFESSESRDIILTNDSSLIGLENENNIPYVYTSDTYPLNTITDTGLKYNTYQKLRLKRDWTYEYTLEILVRMVSIQSNIDLLKLEATTYGTFEYKDNSNDNYTVTLSDPTSGKENRYGSYITGEGNIFSWKLSTAPNYSLDVESVNNSEEPEFDKYIQGKTVAVEKYETERILYNSVFYTEFVGDMAEYCSFDSSAAEETDKTEPNPEVPEYNPVFKPDIRDTTILPYKAQDGISLAVSVGTETRVLVKVPSTVGSVKFDSTSVSAYDTDGGERVFAYSVAFSDLNKSISVAAGEKQLSFKPTDYLKDIVGGTATDPKVATARYLAANLINVCGVFGGSEVSEDIAPYVFDATQAYWNVGFNYTRRDNVDNLSGTNAQGFEWINPTDFTADGLRVPFLTIGSDVGELTYAFAVTEAYTDLRVAVSIGDDDVITLVPEMAESQPIDGKTVYTFKVRTSSPLTYDNVIKVSVINGQSQISHTSGYSVTRALSRIVGHNDIAAGVEKAVALYSLGMAASAFGYSDVIQFTVKNPVGGEGRYEFSIGEYTYDILGGAEETVEVSGRALYIDGKVVSDGTQGEGAEKTLEGDGYAVVRDAQGGFTVTLDGAHINGLYTTNGASLTIILKSDSSIDTPVRAEYTHWIDWGTGGMSVTEYDYGALVTRCSLVIKTDGEKAKLTLGGRLSAIDQMVTIEDGAIVDVALQSANKWDGITCSSLNIAEGGALSVKYIGAEANSQFADGMTDKFAVNATTELKVFGTLDVEWSGDAVTSPVIEVFAGAEVTVSRIGAEIKEISGIVTAGSPLFAGNVTIKGFDNGILLNDETAEQTLTVSGGKLDIVAVSYGINTRNVDDGELYLCRNLYFLGGITNITVGEKGIAVIAVATVTVDAGEVNLVAKHGVGIEGRSVGFWDDYNQVWYSRSTKLVVNTISGSHEVGKLNIYAYDGSAALAVTELNLNGGSVYLYALNTNGVLHTQADAAITVQNADLVIENGKKLDIARDSYGRGIRAESGGEVINVTNSGKLVFKNVQIAIESWGSNVALNNDGLIILDGYSLGLEQWQVDSWQLQITVTNNGQMRYYNQV